MASRSDFDSLISAGGYPGWDQNSAWQDFQATGGGDQYKNLQQNNGGGNGSFTPQSPANIQDLETKAYALVAPYYQKLATEAGGDFTRAKQALVDDYTQGVKQAKQDYAVQSAAATGSLKNSLGTLGVNFGGEQRNAIDSLNQRGAAVYQNNPDGTPNVVQQSDITANPDYTSTMANPANANNTGEGGQEINRMLQDQQLRQEAVQRSTQNNITSYANTLNKQVGTTPAGQLPDPNGDRSTMGTLGLNFVQNTEQTTRQAQLDAQALAEKRTQDVQGIANSLASVNAKEVPQALTDQYLKNSQTDFVNNTQ